MKIKPVIDMESVSEIARNNPNTRGTHLFIDNGQITEEKKDYANLALVSLMYNRGFLKDAIEETESAASEFVDHYESGNTLGL